MFHTKNPFSSILPILLTGKNRETKTIYDIRGLWVDFGVHRGSFHPALGYLLNKVDVYCMNQTDAVIAISEELRRILSKRGVKREKVEVIIGDEGKIMANSSYRQCSFSRLPWLMSSLRNHMICPLSLCFHKL